MLVVSMASFAPAIASLLAFAAPDAGTAAPTAPPDVDPIVGGEVTGEEEYGAIVALLTSQAGLCTGTVVSPRLILTAGHCLYKLDFGDQITVYYGNDLQAEMSVAATGYGSHPDFCDDCREDIYDYGYVELGTDFTPPDGFILPLTDQEEWDEAIRIGNEVTLVGFGEDPNAGNPMASLGTKRVVSTTISRFSELGTEFFAGGDGRDSCQGDSGGPAIVRLSDGTLRLAGIVSRGSDPCGDGGFYGAPFAALSWVREETGVDLLPAGCEDGECLDMSPPVTEQTRCAVASPKRSSLPWSMLVLLGLGLRRRGARSTRTEA